MGATNELREDIKVTGDAHAVAALQRIGGAASHVAEKFMAMGNAALAIGGIAGAFGIVEAVRDTDRLYQSIGRVHAMTGIAASKAHQMFDAFELSGVEMEAAESIITRLSKTQGKLTEEGGKSAAQQAAQWKALGVNMKSGVNEQLLQMAAHAKKLTVYNLQDTFGIGRSQASSMLKMLQQGPERLRAIEATTLAGADLINGKALATYEKMAQARRDLKDAWGDTVSALYKSMMPAITDLITRFKNKIDELQPKIEAIGKFLTSHMTEVVALAKTFVQIMTASKISNMLTGTGLIGNAKRVGGFANGILTGIAPKALGGTFEGAFSFMGKMGPLSALGPVAQILSTAVGRLSVVGAIIIVIAAAFRQVLNNTNGIRDTLMRLIGGIAQGIAKIVSALQPVISLLGALVDILASALLETVREVLWYVDKWLWAVGKIIDLVTFIGDKVGAVIGAIGKMVDWVLDKLSFLNVGGVFDAISVGGTAQKIGQQPLMDPRALNRAMGKKVTGNASATKPPPNNFDFRGSKFDITQNFPDGMDAGRVSVAFTHDLAKLGERPVDSGLRPVFSYR